MRRAMMSPMSPEPKITTRFPGMRPSRFTSFCAVPAVKMPAQRQPGVPSAPRGRSLHPIARMTASASTATIPSVRLT